MHYFAAVVIPPGTTYAEAERHVTVAMEPYDENREVERDDEGYWRNPQDKWDWWQIGGRWTGAWSGYDPENDPTNIETCFLCHGTGQRNDALGIATRREHPGYTCNGCQGKGQQVKWPTGWAAHEGDLLPVAVLLDNTELRRPHTIVIGEGGFHEREWWVPGEGEYGSGGHFDELTDDEWETRLKELLEPYRNCLLVVVDYHN
jgi:hypothetical protein